MSGTLARADLYGSWQGQELLLDDKGTMAMSFAVDGTAKGYRKGTNAATEDATEPIQRCAGKGKKQLSS
jgi:hypothetical protein